MLSKQKIIVECLNNTRHTVTLFFTLFVTTTSIISVIFSKDCKKVNVIILSKHMYYILNPFSTCISCICNYINIFIYDKYHNQVQRRLVI